MEADWPTALLSVFISSALGTSPLAAAGCRVDYRRRETGSHGDSCDDAVVAFANADQERGTE